MIDEMEAELEKGEDGLSKFLKHSNQQSKIIVRVLRS